MGVVTVTLLKVMNLKDKDGVGRSDPYVKLELTKERIGFDKKYGKYQSTTKNSCNPEYNETFTFDNVPDLNDVILHVKIMDSDIGLDDHLGHCEIELEYENLSSTPKPITGIVDPKKFKFFAEEATIHMEISFQE